MMKTGNEKTVWKRGPYCIEVGCQDELFNIFVKHDDYGMHSFYAVPPSDVAELIYQYMAKCEAFLEYDRAFQDNVKRLSRILRGVFYQAGVDWVRSAFGSELSTTE